MKHNDYKIDGHCKTCNKPIFSPAVWTNTIRKYEGQKINNPPPRYKTCLHPLDDKNE